MRATIHHHLLERPAGATARELLDLVFTQPAADAEFGPHFIRTLLSGDPRFSFREADQRWVASVHAALAAALATTEFVVLDVETTGGAAERGDTIIEIGAVRIGLDRRTQRFSQLIDPGRPLSSFITALTGITDAMLKGQPRMTEVLPEFLAFVGNRVLVAHNARFDLSFLNAAVLAHREHPLPQPHLCTLRLARRLLPELRRRGLDAVAAHFGIPLVDRHRALGDALVTTEIFFRFLDLLAARGIERLDEALALQSSARDGRRFLCPLPHTAVAALPAAPGIYRFFGADDHLLYIGKAKDLRRRVGQYLSNADGHSTTTLDLIRHIHAVRVATAGSELEAALMEAEAIRAEQPPYNRLRKHLPRIAFIRLSDDRDFPRLLITARPPAGRARGGHYFGPFRSREAAQRVVDLAGRLFKLRTCSGRLHPDPGLTPCWRGQIETCSAPCNARVTASRYAEQVAAFLRLMAGDTDAAATARAWLVGERERHAEALRFEAAARTQHDLEQLERLLHRQRLLSWVIAQHHFVVLQPSVRADEVLAYLVLGGRLITRRPVGAVADLAALVERAVVHGSAASRTVLGPHDVDGTTILAAWLRDRGERDGFVFRLEEPSAAAAQLGEWATALATLVARPTNSACNPLQTAAAPEP